MKSIKTYLGACAVASLLLTACNDDFVDTQPLDQVSENAVWTDIALADAFVSGLYSQLGQGGFNEQMLASLTDEAMFTHPGRGITTITEARSNPADPGWINATIDWANMYAGIRACNIALDRLTTTTTLTDTTTINRLLGEAYFMRAYYYQQLLRYYGGVPLIDKAFTLDATNFMTPRNTWEEGVKFVVADCDRAYTRLGGRTMAAGRANAAAALALKSRILTYAASDLHDVPTAKAKSGVISAYSNPEFIGYVSGDRAARWQAAKAASKALLDMAAYGYQTNLAAPVSKAEGTTNYMNLSLAQNSGQRDLIFGRHFINSKQEVGGRQGLFNGPNGYHNWAGNTPVQHFVDDFEMMDGTRFDWSNATHAAAPYQNRDPRFYASLLYDGAGWKPRTADVAAKDPVNQIQTGSYEIINASGARTVIAGLDTRNSSVEDWNGSYTGYYMRKFIDPNPAIVDQNTWQQVPWPFFRYTEAIFNYAEACIELGQDAEARTWLNKVRFRAGMPALTETGDALRQRLRNEKRIEMAFEEQRFHDARRWMISPTAFARKADGITIKGTLKAGKSVTLYRYDPTSYDYSYKVFEIDPGKENRAWADKMYFLPIHRDEMNRNNKLVQNPGY